MGVISYKIKSMKTTKNPKINCLKLYRNRKKVYGEIRGKIVREIKCKNGGDKWLGPSYSLTHMGSTWVCGTHVVHWDAMAAILGHTGLT